MVVVEAMQLEQDELLMLTLRPLADVAPQVLPLLEKVLKLQAYAPTYITLIDPP